MHSPDETAQFRERFLGLPVRVLDDGPRGLGIVGELSPGPAELHGQGDEPLLGAVVQVALDPQPLSLGRVDDPGPATLKLPDPGGQVGGGRPEQVAGHRRVAQRQEVTRPGAASSSGTPIMTAGTAVCGPRSTVPKMTAPPCGRDPL